MLKLLVFMQYTIPEQVKNKSTYLSSLTIHGFTKILLHTNRRQSYMMKDKIIKIPVQIYPVPATSQLFHSTAHKTVSISKMSLDWSDVHVLSFVNLLNFLPPGNKTCSLDRIQTFCSVFELLRDWWMNENRSRRCLQSICRAPFLAGIVAQWKKLKPKGK